MDDEENYGHEKTGSEVQKILQIPNFHTQQKQEERNWSDEEENPNISQEDG